MNLETPFTKQVGIELPLIGGPMFPCSNPELVAAVSEAGGIGIVQPLSLTFVHGYDFREGVRYIKSMTNKPWGMNVLVEKSQKIYEERMRNWVDIALEEGCRFFVTALGNPTWVIEKARPKGAIIYHDVTEKKWAQKAVDYGVDGLICVNNRAGGHAGPKTPQELYDSLKGFGLPLVCAGGVGSEETFVEMLKIGYSGVQMGTRFIASAECKTSDDYKAAIVKAQDKDIVLTDRATAVPIAVINTPWLQKTGTKASPLARLLLKNHKTKHWVRAWYSLRSAVQLRRAIKKGFSSKDFYQAGKSVQGIQGVEPVKEIVSRFARLAQEA